MPLSTCVSREENLSALKSQEKKDAQPVDVFLKNRPEVLDRIKRQIKKPLRDAAAVNATRWSLFNALKAFGLTVETGSGALTKFNRHTFGVPKEHWLDALCAAG